ncbi:CHAT domain-containing protein [Mycena pura]|uniref:CHAT domain-containing protein n=1 Tax=Mycena pura TaxID=153505 RepID=A0AAD6VJ07_9AGAR|nr:CHAT domain-containing protein [Mycena pura]
MNMQAFQIMVILPRIQWKVMAVALGNSCVTDYQRLGDPDDLETAVQYFQAAVDLAPAGHPDRAMYLQDLASGYGVRYQRLGDLNDLEAALQHSQAAVDLIPAGHPERAWYLNNLASSYGEHYQRLGDLNDLEEVLQHSREALDLVPTGHPDRAGYLKNIATGYRDRYLRLGNLDDLEGILQHLQAVVDNTPAGHPDRAGYLQDLATGYRDRYQRLGSLKDLEAALWHYQAAVELAPAGHSDKAQYLQNLATAYGDLYKRFGDLNDLEAALQHSQAAVGLLPAGHPDRALYIQNLASSYGNRHQRLGDLNDLEAALQHFQAAMDITPIGHPKRAGHLISLATGCYDRYQKLGDLNDLEVALHHLRAAVDLTPAGHPDQVKYLQILALFLMSKYQRLKQPNDLESIQTYFTASLNITTSTPEHSFNLNTAYLHLDMHSTFSITPIGHPKRAGHLISLATGCYDRYQKLGDLNDLEVALHHLRAAVDLTPAGHPDQVKYLQILALFLMSKYQRLKQPNDLESIQTYFTASLNITTSTPEVTWDRILRWASFAAQFQPEHCIFAFRHAFYLLPELLWIGHSIPVRHDMIRRLRISQVTATATRNCINLLDLPSAVEIMEQGLGTVYQQMLQLKTDIDELPPAQAQAFQHYSMELYNVGSDPSMSLVNKRNHLIQDIRKQDGFEYFLLPKPYKVLCQASQGGPVIILNSHQDGCDAIIMLVSAEPLHVPLDVTLKELDSQKVLLQQLLGHCNVRVRGESDSTRLFGCKEGFTSKSPRERFEKLLNWLWTGVASPIYHTLEMNNVHSGRLWWLPTGAFTGLPLHACAPTDQFIHSYTATLGSLLDAYSKKSSKSPAKVSVIGVTDTGSGRTRLLPGVQQEVKNICSVVPLSQVECLKDQQATVDAVRLQLEHSAWVHLACHGTQDLSEPTRSHLLLYGGNLELKTILRMPLSNAEVVFLAACQTAMGDSELVNESIHLGGGFIAAGFRGAIGMLWSMNDQDGPLVAKKFYSHLFRDGRQPQARDAAEALHLAIKQLRRQDVPYERWVPIIHMGI